MWAEAVVFLVRGRLLGRWVFPRRKAGKARPGEARLVVEGWKASQSVSHRGASRGQRGDGMQGRKAEGIRRVRVKDNADRGREGRIQRKDTCRILGGTQ